MVQLVARGPLEPKILVRVQVPEPLLLNLSNSSQLIDKDIAEGSPACQGVNRFRVFLPALADVEGVCTPGRGAH